jgi:signal peptidase I
MEPRLFDGDHLRVEPFDVGRRPAVGDIVVFRRGARLVTHRIVSLHGGTALTRGDACARNDLAVPVESLIGRVADIRRSIKGRLRWMKQTTARILRPRPTSS